MSSGKVVAPPSITSAIPAGKAGNPSAPSSSSTRQRQSNGAGSARVPTKDSVYENKRKVYEQTMDTLSKEIDSLKAKSVELSEKIKLLVSGEEGKAEREAIFTALQKMRKQKDQLMEERNVLSKRLDEALEIARSRGAELDVAREKLPCKRREDIDQKIADLNRSIESGVSLSEEKKLVAEISKLHKARRSFDAISSLVAGKDQIDAQVESIRSSMKKLDPELKALKAHIKEENEKYTQLLTRNSSSTNAIQSMRKNLEEIRSQIDKKFKERSSAYEAFSLAKEAHKEWASERQEKYQALLVRREIENEINDLEIELHSLSVDKIPKEVESLEALENVLSAFIAPSKEAEKKMPSGSTPAPRPVEGIDEKKFVVLEKTEESYFVGKKANPKPASLRATSSTAHAATKTAKTSSISLPHWVSLDLEVYAIGAVHSSDDAKKAIERITEMKQKIVEASRSANKDKEEERSQLRAKIDALKAKLSEAKDTTKPSQ